MRLALAGLATLVMAACGSTATEMVVAEGYQDLPANQVLVGTTFYTTVDGIRAAVQDSDSIYTFEDSATAQLFGVDLVMFDSTGRRTATLVSETGQLNQTTQKMVAQGNVVLILLADGRRIETEELHYDPQRHQIWSDVPTVMFENGSRTETDGFRADDKFENITFVNARGAKLKL